MMDSQGDTGAESEEYSMYPSEQNRRQPKKTAPQINF